MYYAALLPFHLAYLSLVDHTTVLITAPYSARKQVYIDATPVHTGEQTTLHIT